MITETKSKHKARKFDWIVILRKFIALQQTKYKMLTTFLWNLC